MNKLLAALIALTATVSANAGVITFEQGAGDAVYTGSNTLTSDQSHLYAGQSWREAGAFVRLGSSSDHAHVHGNYGSSAGFDLHGSYSMTVDMGGALFSLSSFTSYIKYGAWVVTGSNGAVAALGADSYGSVLHSFDSSFSSLSWFTISGGNNEFEVDNISLNEATVPEPTSLALVALSLAGLGFARRAQRKA